MMLADPPDHLRLAFLRHAEVGSLEPSHRLSAFVDHQHVEQNLARSDPKRGSFCGCGRLTGPNPNRGRRGLRVLSEGKENDRACDATEDGEREDMKDP
jgi:hypothetical protein